MKSYIYLDYEPPPDIQYQCKVAYQEIRGWVSREYSLNVLDQYINQVRLDHGISTKHRDGHMPKDRSIPPKKRAAIEVVLRHFRLLS